jgi:hypothetical protein
MLTITTIFKYEWTNNDDMPPTLEKPISKELDALLADPRIQRAVDETFSSRRLKNPIGGKDGLDPEHPLVKLNRRLSLELQAKEQKSDLYCTTCDANLPIRHLTTYGPVEVKGESFDKHFCSLCQKDFYISNAVLLRLPLSPEDISFNQLYRS